MNNRRSPRINITLPQQLADQVSMYQAKYGLQRSAIIHQALLDWLAKQQPLEPESSEPLLINGRPYEPGKFENDYMTPGMSSTEVINTMVEFDAAKKQHYTKQYYGR